MGWQWVAHFDNTEWTANQGSWVTDHWEDDTGELYLYPPIGSWDNGYRPTHIRANYTGVGTQTLTLYDTSWSTIAQNFDYVSGASEAITYDTDDIHCFYMSLADDVTNIEFYESVSSSSSSSRSSSSSSRSSSSSSSSSKSSSSSSRSSSSSSRSSSSSSSSSRSSSSSSSSRSSSSSSSRSSSSSSSSRSSSSSSSSYSSSSSSRSSSSSSSSWSSSSSSSSAQHHQIDVYLDTETHKVHRIDAILDSELWNPFRNEIQLDIEISASSMIWGYVKDWRGHIVRKQCVIIISSLDGTVIYGRTNSDKATGSFNTKISVASGTNVLVSCFLEGTFRGQENLAGSLIFTTASSSSSSSSISSSSSSRSSSSSSSA